MDEDSITDSKLNPCHLQQRENSIKKETHYSYPDVHTVTKKETNSEDHCTSSDTNVVIKEEEFVAEESDTKKHDAVLHESVSPPSDHVSTIIKEEEIVEGSESALGEVDTVVESEEIFLEEADHEQFIGEEENCSYDVSKDIISENEKQSFEVTVSPAGLSEALPLNITQDCNIPPPLLVYHNSCLYDVSKSIVAQNEKQSFGVIVSAAGQSEALTLNIAQDLSIPPPLLVYHNSCSYYVSKNIVPENGNSSFGVTVSAAGPSKALTLNIAQDLSIPPPLLVYHNSSSYNVNKDIISENKKQSYGVKVSAVGPSEALPLNTAQDRTNPPPLLVYQNTSVQSDKKYDCDVCNKTFTNKKDLTSHKVFVHSGGAKKYKCDICKKSFRYSYNLTKHQLVYSQNNKKHECDVCNKIFHSSRSFSRHKLLHSDNKKFQCDVCKKSFTTVRSLNDHKFTHIKVKNYSCDVCNKAFIRIAKLNRHKLIHSGIKNHKCDICNKCFTFKSTLTQHKSIHRDITNSK